MTSVRCPNYVLCKNMNNSHNGVCFNCNSSIWGYEHRKYMVSNFNKPSAVYELTSGSLGQQEFINLMVDLFETRNEVGKLDIIEEKRECPCCFKESDVNVVNPFCGDRRHTICGSCFKRFYRNEFVDDLVDIAKPKCNDIWNDYFRNIPSEMAEYIYNQNEPMSDWPDYIKEIYPIMRKYYNEQVELYNLIDNEKRNMLVRRICPYCEAGRPDN